MLCCLYVNCFETLTLTLDISDILVYRVGLSDSMLKSGSFSIFAKVSLAKFDTGSLRERVMWKWLV